MRVPLNMSLQKIDEEPELFGDDDDCDNYDRLSGGCLSKKESKANVDGNDISAASKEQKL